MLIALRSRHPVTLALLLAGAPGCNLVLDIDRLDRGSGEVEVIASGECNPGKIALTSDHVYWTITAGSGDEGCPTKPRNAIRRLAVDSSGPSGAPVDVVTTNLDGDGKEATDDRPWQLEVIGDGVYWNGSSGKVCVATAGETDQGCGTAPGLPPPCPSLSMRRAANELYLHAGDCASGGEIQHYDTVAQKPTTTGLSVSGNFVYETDVSATAPRWVAWVDKPTGGCSKDENVAAKRLNVALPAVAGWSSCASGFLARSVRDVAIDGDHLYWIEVESDVPGAAAGSLYVLPLSQSLTAAQKPTLVVRDLKEPNALALDARHVYITSVDHNGAVLFVPKGIPESSKTPDEIGILADNRDVPYDITAEDPDWVYWLCSTTHTVERARKPAE